MIAKILLSIGITLRSLVLLVAFLSVFIFGAVVLPIQSNSEINWLWLFCLVPLALIDIVLIIALCSESTRSQLANKQTVEHHQSDKSPSKLSVGFACHATYVAVGIILICLLMLLGYEDYLPGVFGIYVFLGWIVIYKIMWPIYKKKMK